MHQCTQYGNKQDELKTCVRSQGFDLTAVTETWWDSSYDWNIGMKGYTLFRRDSPDSVELCLGEDDELMGQDKTADYCCCGCLLPKQEEKVRPSTGSMKQPQSHRPWFFWGTLLP